MACDNVANDSATISNGNGNIFREVLLAGAHFEGKYEPLF